MTLLRSFQACRGGKRGHSRGWETEATRVIWITPLQYSPKGVQLGFRSEGLEASVLEVGDFLVPLPKHKRTTVEKVGIPPPFSSPG